MRSGRERGADEAVPLGEFDELANTIDIGRGIELDVERAVDFRERVAPVVLSLRDDAFRGRRSCHGDVGPLGVEVEARERAAGEACEDQVLRGPVRLCVRRLTEALDDRELQSLPGYSGQRVITTFFSV
jgi:hypothetical protein